LLIGERGGKRVALERHVLADSEAAFWTLAAQPAKAQEQRGGAFGEFLARVTLHAAPLAEPEDLAWLLASYAREAAHRIELASPKAQQQLTVLKKSLESALGVDFDAKDGEHFFRSTLVQTLFYGVFAAWVLRHQGSASGPFDWKTAAYDLNVPMISALFEQLSQPTKLKALDLTAVLDWAADALNRVDQATFFKKFCLPQQAQCCARRPVLPRPRRHAQRGLSRDQRRCFAPRVAAHSAAGSARRAAGLRGARPRDRRAARH
jgi:hypothetical protein